MIVVCPGIGFTFLFCSPVSISRQIEAAGLQLPPAEERLGIGNLHDPGTRGAFCGIEQSALSVDVEKDLLHQIFGFCPVSENPSTDAPDELGVALKKNRQRISVRKPYKADQALVSGRQFVNMWAAPRPFARSLSSGKRSLKSN